jgi:lipoprotein-anchoring transpeptidase ErfK/SrfK
MARRDESFPTPLQQNQAEQAVNLARQALQRGDRHIARHYATRAAALNPQLEDAWLFLAAVASPHASLAYLQRALEINPASQRARMGMHWAVQRLRASPPPIQKPDTTIGAAISLRAPVTPPSPPAAARTRSRLPALAFAFILLCIALGLMIWAWEPMSGPALSQARRFALALVYSETPTASVTPTSSATPTSRYTPIPSPTPSSTATPTETPTPTASATPLPTHTLLPAPTETATPENTPLPPPTLTPTIVAAAPNPTPRPTRRPKPQKIAGPEGRPTVVAIDERWVDVDLSSQTAYAMVGDQITNSFLVSTGMWPTTTVTGVFRIYVKYRSALMYGPGYYLPNVPYVMYFYKDYGLHGTYWHNNFGHPMSHGCVNFRTDDAGWLFNWTVVGTVVRVHQ